jgi:anti-sigma B factor antagonist
LSLHIGERTQLPGFGSVSIERDADTAFIRLEGELDLNSEDSFLAEVARVAAWRPSEVIVDLRDVAFIDLRVLRILLDLDASSREDGFGLTLVHADGQVQRVLRITGIDRLLPLEQPPSELKKESTS